MLDAIPGPWPAITVKGDNSMMSCSSSRWTGLPLSSLATWLVHHGRR
jgi:hypothetical protein